MKRHFFYPVTGAYWLGLALLSVIAATCLAYYLWVQSAPSRYQEIRNDWHNSPYARYLPVALPPSATHICLNHSAEWGQGGTHTIVSYRLPPVEIQSIIRQFPAGPVPPQTTPFLPRNLLEPTFNVYVFEKSDANNWNHPWEYGVAIDATTDEVLYWISAD